MNSFWRDGRTRVLMKTITMHVPRLCVGMSMSKGRVPCSSSLRCSVSTVGWQLVYDCSSGTGCDCIRRFEVILVSVSRRFDRDWVSYLNETNGLMDLWIVDGNRRMISLSMCEYVVSIQCCLLSRLKSQVCFTVLLSIWWFFSKLLQGFQKPLFLVWVLRGLVNNAASNSASNFSR